MIEPVLVTSRNFERRRSFAIGSQKEGFRSGTKESYNNQNIISIAPGADIQKAIDTIYATGGGKVVLLNGTHVVNSDINVKSFVTVEGETTNTIVDFNNGPYGFVISGEQMTQYTGTISVTNNSSSITGSGTNFDGDLVGKAIFIDGAWNYVASINSSTSLTLESEYVGPDISGVTLVVSETINSVILNKVLIQNSSGIAISISFSFGTVMQLVDIFNCSTGIYSNYSEFVAIDGISVFTADSGILFENSYSITFSNSSIANCTGNGIEFLNSGDSTANNFGSIGCSGSGVVLDNCDSLTCIAFTVSDNTGNGIELVSTSDDNQFFGGKVNRNGGSGVKLTATSDRNAVVGVTCDSNTGYGINIAAASCDNNMISSCALVSNTAGQLNNAGTGTKARGVIGNVDIG